MQNKLLKLYLSPIITITTITIFVILSCHVNESTFIENGTKTNEALEVQDNIDMARELCCKALIKPSRENCDTAYLFGKTVLNDADQKNEKIKHLKGLLCTSCIFCSPQNLEGLIQISDEVIAFKFDEINNSEIHKIHAYLIKINYSVYKKNISDAHAYMNIASHLVKNYKHSKSFDTEYLHRMKNIISLQKSLILKITDDTDK